MENASLGKLFSSPGEDRATIRRLSKKLCVRESAGANDHSPLLFNGLSRLRFGGAEILPEWSGESGRPEVGSEGGYRACFSGADPCLGSGFFLLNRKNM